MNTLIQSFSSVIRSIFPAESAMDEPVNERSLFDQCSFVVVRSATLDENVAAEVSLLDT